MATKMVIDNQQICKGLQLDNQYLNAIVNSMGCGVIVTDKNTCIEIINREAEYLTGWNKHDAVGKNLLEVFRQKNVDTEEKINNLAARAIREGEVIELSETKLIKKNEDGITTGGTVTPLRDTNEKILGAVLVFQDISQRKRKEEQLIRNAFYDSITGLPNRILFKDRLTQAFEHSKRKKNYRFGVLFVDLDGFKEINDKFGHGMGDKLLLDMGKRLRSCLRGSDTVARFAGMDTDTTDTVARFGGDEFAILLKDIKSEDDAEKTAERILENLKTPFYIHHCEILITASIGIALSNESYQEPENLLEDADSAMYDMKKTGKAKYKVFRKK